MELDRIDFDGPYSIENSVPCCKHCNYMKGCLDVNYFIGACIKIVLNNFDNENTYILKNIVIILKHMTVYHAIIIVIK